MLGEGKGFPGSKLFLELSGRNIFVVANAVLFSAPMRPALLLASA